MSNDQDRLLLKHGIQLTTKRYDE